MKPQVPEISYIECVRQYSEQLLEIKEEEDIYPLLGDTISKILPGAYFMVSKLQTDEENFLIIISSGFDSYFNKIKSLL